MAETERHKLIHDKRLDQDDLVKHHYNRRSIWGTDTMLYHRVHPMTWKQVASEMRPCWCGSRCARSCPRAWKPG